MKSPDGRARRLPSRSTASRLGGSLALPNLNQPLLKWFRKNARPLPWRENRDPYRIWISEVMLQQTQVATVIPYFHRFLQQYPTLPDLARADEQAVLRLWEGLGYYRRARDVCRAARLLGENNCTTIPDDPALVQRLPGFGRYTTNAVLSQAYGRRLPILEANSVRVLSRLFGIAEDPKQGPTRRRLWTFAEDLLPRTSPGDFNQALMELGALVCTPTKPNCGVCPVRDHCAARRQHRQDELPMRSRKADVVTVEEVAVVVRKKDRVLLVQRPEGGRWERMWEFPHQSTADGAAPHAAATALLGSLGIEAAIESTLATIRHSVTRFRITMVCVSASYRRGKVGSSHYPTSAWVKLDELVDYPLSAPQRRVARLLQE